MSTRIKYIIGGILLGLTLGTIALSQHPTCGYTAKPSPVDAGADDTAGPGAADGESTG